MRRRLKNSFFCAAVVPILTKAPAAQDEFLHRRLDPPHRIGCEAESAIGIEFLHALHQADIAFGDQFRNGQAIAAIAHGDFGNESQVRRYELRSSGRVFMLLIALGEHIFLLGCKYRIFFDFRQIAVEAVVPPKGRDSCRNIFSL
jgi:hypothetical protein